MSSKSHTATPPTVHIVPRLDICCALFLLPLAMSLKSHTHSSSELQTGPVGLEKKQWHIFNGPLHTYIYTPLSHTQTHVVPTLAQKTGTML